MSKPTRQRTCPGCGKIETLHASDAHRFCVDCTRKGMDPKRLPKAFRLARRTEQDSLK